MPFRGHVDSEDSEKPGVGENLDPDDILTSEFPSPHKPSYPGLAIMSENLTGISQVELISVSGYQQPPLISQMVLSSPDRFT